MPAVTREYYQGRPLSFDSAAVKSEFQNIERHITRQLGQFNPVGQIMRRMCKEYRMVVRMLEADDLVHCAAECFQRQLLTGKHVLITAGPTQLAGRSHPE